MSACAPTRSDLMVQFVPSVERDGKTIIDQQHWVDAALEMCGRVFGGGKAQARACAFCIPEV